jgi:four helix bundle protein
MTSANELRKRTKEAAIRIVRLYRSLPKSADAQVIGKQLLRSGTSVAANYRAVCRARSDAEFISKIGTVLEEADETSFWLELLVETGIVAGQLLQPLHDEMDQLTRIFSSARATALARRNRKSQIKNRKYAGSI